MRSLLVYESHLAYAVWIFQQSDQSVYSSLAMPMPLIFLPMAVPTAFHGRLKGEMELGSSFWDGVPFLMELGF